MDFNKIKFNLNQNLSKILFVIILLAVLVFSSYYIHNKEIAKNNDNKNNAEELCQEQIIHCKNLKDITFFRYDPKNFKGMVITANRDATNKLEWSVNVTLINGKGFESNQFFKEDDFFTLIKKIESLIYKGVRE